MKFVTAWAEIAKKNVSLKIAVICLSFTSITFSILAAKFALNEPLLIERSCASEPLKLASTKHTENEIRSFLKEAISQRMNTKSPLSFNFLSLKELKSREIEQKELAQKKMKQTVLLNEVKFQNEKIVVDADRLISVGKIRTALSFPLFVKVESTNRTQSNPYGLILTSTSPIKEKED